MEDLADRTSDLLNYRERRLYNTRLKMDSLQADLKDVTAKEKKKVLQTWSDVLENEENIPDD